MRTLAVVAALVGLSPARAAFADEGPRAIETGVFLGTFISNYYHQFFDEARRADRQELDRYSPEVGVRFALFPFRYVGFELEGSWILASAKQTADAANIFGVHGQVIAQLPGRLTPFIAAGAGVQVLSSEVMGDDADLPIHAGIGVRYFAARTLALRLDARLLRGPSSKSDAAFDASYGEVTFGVSFVPDRR